MISVCMIARNEAGRIATAIESTRGLADEVIVVDTGSTDDTVAVASTAGARVYLDGDYRNLGGSRNAAIDHAQGDWVVILDCDETIADPAGVRAFLQTTTADAVYIRETYMDGDTPSLAFSQMRCWRKGMYRYSYRCHEVPEPVHGWGEIAYTEFVWQHRPPPRVDKQQYYLMLLLLDADEHPGDARVSYYLARQWMYCGAYRKAIETTRAYLGLTKPGAIDRGEAWRNMALCYEALGEIDEAVDALWRAAQEEPQRRSRWGQLAEVYHAKGRHEVAAGMLRLALTLPETEAYQDTRWTGAHIYDLLARCYWYANRWAEGHEYARKAAALAPDDTRIQANLAFFDAKAVNDGHTDT